MVAMSDPLGGLLAICNADDFWIYNYKVTLCSRTDVHDWNTCFFGHVGETALRRHPGRYRYSPMWCPYIRKKVPCPSGDVCPFAHNIFEIWLHPLRYRTRLCRSGVNCNRAVCFFAHTPEQMRQPGYLEVQNVQATAGLPVEIVQLPVAAVTPQVTSVPCGFSSWNIAVPQEATLPVVPVVEHEGILPVFQSLSWH